MGKMNYMGNDNFFSFREKDEEENNSYSDEYEIINLSSKRKTDDFSAACLERICEKGDLFVKIGEEKLKCEYPGKVLNFKGYKGNLICPDSKILCGEKYLCKFGCVEKFDNKN